MPAIQETTTLSPATTPASQIIQFESMEDAEQYLANNPSASVLNFRVKNPTTGLYEEVD
jgi:hypothetical protein